MMRRLMILGAAALIGGGALAEGERAYQRGDYRAAAAAYGRALAAGDSSAVVRYNLGTSLLRLGRHDEARPHLEAAALARAPLEVRFRAEYNAGNTHLVPVAAGSVPSEQRRERLFRAIAHYRRALLLRPGDVDAKWNLELANRLLREQTGGGGGEDDEDNESPSGGGGENDPSPAAPQPQPGSADAGAGRPMTREQAERILAGAETREQRILRQQLKQDQTRIHGVRDW
ncbi:MAG TPA: tetratricopeptide repeat protein [Longimicrobium sp.]|nr:tetratricopeptide repeat protein [Longimicrobium sp.]